MTPTMLPRTLIVLCTYNERKTIPSLLEKIEGVVAQTPVLLIDDGSPDGTGSWFASQMKAQPHWHYLQRGAKLGLGSAIQAGLQYGIEHGYDWVLNLDADHSHDPARIPSFFQMAEQQPVDLVIGSRYVAGGGMLNCSWKRHLVSRTANLYARAFLGLRVRDCSSAYRLYRLQALERIPWSKLECRGYGFLEEILWWMVIQKRIVREIPIEYIEREQGDSKISIHEALGTMRIIHRLFRRRWAMMWGRAPDE